MSKNPYDSPRAAGESFDKPAGHEVPGIRFKLSVMMFLEFFIWGAWLPPSFGFFGPGALDFNWWKQDLLNFAFPLPALLAMFFANQFVDRNFAAERFLAASHLIGGLAILGFGGAAW